MIIDFNTELGSLWLTNLPLNEMKKTAILLECTFWNVCFAIKEKDT